jgi:hypothetical protein
MAINKGKILFSIIIFLLLCGGAQVTPAQFSLPKQSRVIFSGQLLDVTNGEPLSGATITIRTEYEDLQAKTDASGNFLLEVNDSKGLKTFLIIFSHPDYREKDLSATFRTTFQDKARFSLKREDKNSTANIKYRKEKLSLNCGGKANITTKERRPLDFQFDCQADTHTISMTLSRGNSFSVTGSGNIEMEIDEDKTRIETDRDEPLKLDIKGLMFKR